MTNTRAVFGKRLMMVAVAAALVGTTSIGPDQRQAFLLLDGRGSTEQHFAVGTSASLAREMGSITVAVSLGTACGRALRVTVRPDDPTMATQVGTLSPPSLDSGICTAVVELDGGDDEDAGSPSRSLGVSTSADLGTCGGAVPCTSGFTLLIEADDPHHAYSYSIIVTAIHRDVPDGGCGSGPDRFNDDAMVTLVNND